LLCYNTYMSSVMIGNDIYDVVPDEARLATAYLLKLRKKMGIDDSSSIEGKRISPSILKFVMEIYRVWSNLFPDEHREFIENTTFELKYEKSVRDLVKQGGYSPTSYPYRLHSLFQILIPSVKVQDKRFWKPLFNKIPELKRSNYA